MAIEYSNVNQSRFIHIYVNIVCYIISFLSSVECAVFSCDFNVTEPVGFLLCLYFCLNFCIIVINVSGVASSRIDT